MALSISFYWRTDSRSVEPKSCQPILEASLVIYWWTPVLKHYHQWYNFELAYTSVINAYLRFGKRSTWFNWNYSFTHTVFMQECPLNSSNWVHTHSLTFLNLESLQRSIAIIVVKKIDSTIRKVLMLLYERQRKYPKIWTEQIKFWKQV